MLLATPAPMGVVFKSEPALEFLEKSGLGIEGTALDLMSDIAVAPLLN